MNRIGADPGVRLACQLHPMSNISVVPLLVPSVEGIVPVGSQQVKPGREQEIAILFCDIRSFTMLTEERLPYDIVFLLNRYFAIVGQAVERSGGRLDKFIGDGAMALFGLSSTPEEACRHALKAAAAIVKEMDRLNEELSAELPIPIRVAIGIHSGPAIVGAMGYGSVKNLTAIGDTVNVASRLESVAKEFDATVVVSEPTIVRAGSDTEQLESREIAIRGRAEPLRVYIVSRETSRTVRMNKLWKRRYLRFRNRLAGKFFDTRYGRELLINAIGPRVQTMTVDCGDHLMTFVPGDYIGKKIFRKGHFERDHVDRLLATLKERQLLRDNCTLLELGGNIGTQTIYFALSGSFSRIVSVEPDPRNFQLLGTNIAQNELGDLVRLVNSAAGESEGEIDFFQHRSNHGKSSAFRQSAADSKIVVPVRPVSKILADTDTSLDDVGLVWMDIEGYEPHACRSMEASALSQSPALHGVLAGLLRAGANCGLRKIPCRLLRRRPDLPRGRHRAGQGQGYPGRGTAVRSVAIRRVDIGSICPSLRRGAAAAPPIVDVAVPVR